MSRQRRQNRQDSGGLAVNKPGVSTARSIPSTLPRPHARPACGGRVEKKRGGVQDRRRLRRAASFVAALAEKSIAPSLLPAHRTGRAAFPHPALGRVTQPVADRLIRGVRSPSSNSNWPSVVACIQRWRVRPRVSTPLAEGKSIKEVAAILDLSPRTVEFHKYRIMGLLAAREVRSRAGAVRAFQWRIRREPISNT